MTAINTETKVVASLRKPAVFGHLPHLSGGSLKLLGGGLSGGAKTKEFIGTKHRLSYAL